MIGTPMWRRVINWDENLLAGRGLRNGKKMLEFDPDDPEDIRVEVSWAKRRIWEEFSPASDSACGHGLNPTSRRWTLMAEIVRASAAVIAGTILRMELWRQDRADEDSIWKNNSHDKRMAMLIRCIQEEFATTRRQAAAISKEQSKRFQACEERVTELERWLEKVEGDSREEK